MDDTALDDAALVPLALAGHADAYAQLVGRWAGCILAECQAGVNRWHVAEELAQEVFVRGFENLPSLADPGRFGPWLVGIAKNVCCDWRKSRQNGQVPFIDMYVAGQPPFQPEAPPCNEAASQDEAAWVMRAVEALPEEYRVVLMMYYFQTLKYDDIALALDLSYATVNARLTRARALLRDRLKDRP